MVSFEVKLDQPHPRARGIATVLALAGTLCARDFLAVGVVWLAVVVPIAAVAGIGRQHFRFVLTIVAPIAVALLFVWGWLVGAPPGAPVGSSPEGGCRFAALVGLRLALLGGIAQLCLLSIPTGELVFTLKRWGLRGEGLVIVIGAFSLLPELRLRADQVLTARLARGFVRKAGFISRARQLPHLLRPLFAWALRSAIQRSESWEHRGLILKLQSAEARRKTWSGPVSILFLGLSTSWLAYNLLRMRLTG
jgi:energy-coupling factor transporter transmembrane protein EcfT